MKKRLCCALLALLMAAPLCACGGAGRRGETAASPAEEAPAAAETVTAIDEPAFPLLSAPFSESESEAMVNHNAARFALLVDNFYYTRGYYADGGCALVPLDVDGLAAKGVPVLPTSLPGALCVCPTASYEGFFVARLRRTA